MPIEEEFLHLAPRGETLLTIGVFDGVHHGHQKLLARLVDQSRRRQLSSGVVTFKNHPLDRLKEHSCPPALISGLEKVHRIQNMGIDFIVELEFSSELARTSAAVFCSLLQKHLNMQGLVLGFDFAMGRDREGDLDRIKGLGNHMGFSVDIVEPFVLEGGIVSSTSIRQALAQGDIRKANRQLGWRYSLEGEVTAGKGLGKKIGFPTANIEINPLFAMPPNGIYATFCHLEGRRLPSATNIGTGPTFGNGQRRIEVHLLDYAADLYGKHLKIELVDRIRDELAFEDTDSLRKQIADDIRQIRTLLERTTNIK